MPRANAPTGLTPNQLVARNLRRARTEAGWNQTRMTEELASRGGLRWSKATLSAAETAADKPDGRAFTTDELIALSHTFDRPVAWWLLPQEDEPPHPVRLPGVQEPLRPAEYERRLFHVDDEMDARARACFEFLDEWSWETARRLIQDSIVVQLRSAVAAQREAMTEELEDVGALLAAVRDAVAGTGGGSLLEGLEQVSEQVDQRRPDNREGGSS